MLPTVAVTVALALAMVACSSAADTTAAPETPAAPAETTIAPVDATPAETAPPPTSTTTGNPAGAPAVTTAAAQASTSPVVLTATAVGDIALGADAESALAGLTALFGPPVFDTGWGPQESPCDNMGSRSRSASWNTFQAFFATGPTEYMTKPGDHLSAYQLLDAGLDAENGPAQDRFRLSDGSPALHRTLEELQAWNPSLQRFNSEIEGPIWTTGQGADQLSGSLSVDKEGEPERSSTIRAGLFCID